jgi:hypothetical protein
MNNTLIAGLLNAQNQNQIALRAAVEEFSNWVEQRGSADIANDVRCALATLDENLEFIRDGITELSTSGRPRT